MCVGENHAPQAVRYVNAQLALLYKDAVDCFGKHHDPTNTPAEQCKYQHALANFTFTDQYAPNKTMFGATFDQPEIKFICDHDAILHLKVKNCSYRLDYSKSSTMKYSGKDRVQTLSNHELSFRVPFETRSLPVRSKGSKISQGRNLAQLIVLNLLEAKFVSAEPPVTVGLDVLIEYLTEYLAFLHNAGNHVLYSLPNYDDRLAINYSLMHDSDSTVLEVNDIPGVSVDKINAYLASIWFKAAMMRIGGDATDWKLLCPAEYRTSWHPMPETGDHFRLHLGAPRVTLLCSREAIISFNVDEALFYEDTDLTEPVRTYNHHDAWKIDVLVDIIHESDRFVTRCVLDVASAHHFDYTSFEKDEITAAEDYRRISEFFSSTYLLILESIDLHVIYSFDKRLIAPGDSSDGSSEDSNSDEEPEDTGVWDLTGGYTGTRFIEWRKMITHCDMHGFDQVMAISQSTINAIFQLLWSGGQSDRHSDHALVKWSYEETFNAHFKPMTLRLLSNKRVIVLIHIESGHLKVPSESQEYPIGGWHLAFEVNLEKVTHSDFELKVSESWTEEYKKSSVYKEHGGRDDRVLEHIVLDFSHAEFVYKLSNFENTFSFSQSKEHRHIEHIKAAIRHIGERYLPYLAQSGFGIINTVPVWKTKTTSTSVCLTTIDFHVYSKNKITRDDCEYVTAGLEPVIAVLGMTEFRQLPALRLEYSSSFTIRASRKISYDTVAISRSTFMENLLDTLGLINTHTTIIPLPSRVVNGAWQPRLTTWSEQNQQSSQKCEWKGVSVGAGFTKYRWQYSDGWKYEHNGSGEINNSTYNVLCSTRNYLELPTAARDRSMDIKLSGETDVEMSVQSAARQGSSKATARWSAVISIQSESDGLHVKVTGMLTPRIIEVPSAPNQFCPFPDLRQELAKHFPKKIDLSRVLAELKVFEGVSHCAYPGLNTYCLANPVFTQKGDVIFELRLQGEGGAQTARRNNGGNRSSSARTISRQSSQAVLTCGGPFLQKAKAPVTTRAPQDGERSSTPSTLNGRDDDQGHANGNGNSMSSPYRATASIEGGDVEHEPEAVEGFGESEQAL